MTKPDRRRAPRTRLDELVYIGMGPDNGGVVLDVSDGGLSFRAVAPIQPTTIIHFSLSVVGPGRIEGTGEVAWADELRTTCGLRFTSLPGSTREHLQTLTNQSPTPEATHGETSPPPPQATESLDPRVRQSELSAEPVPYDLSAAEVGTSEPKVLTFWEEPFFRGLLLGLLSAALMVAAYVYGRRMGESHVDSSAGPAANPTSQMNPPNREPTPGPSFDTPAAAPADTSKSVGSSETKLPAPGLERTGLGMADHRAPLSVPDGQAELADALAYLRGPAGSRDTSSGVRLLWAAVGSGNTTAEVVLADLYLHGDGVTRNCAQGRVLLTAASAKGNIRAKQKLEELNANGCP